jgi:hypothetical protein
MSPGAGKEDCPAMTMTVTPTASRPQTGCVADDPDPEVPERAQRRRYSAAYKQRILTEYESLTAPARARCCAGRACTPR